MNGGRENRRGKRRRRCCWGGLLPNSDQHNHVDDAYSSRAGMWLSRSQCGTIQRNPNNSKRKKYKEKKRMSEMKQLFECAWSELPLALFVLRSLQGLGRNQLFGSGFRRHVLTLAWKNRGTLWFGCSCFHRLDHGSGFKPENRPYYLALPYLFCPSPKSRSLELGVLWRRHWWIDHPRSNTSTL